MSQATYLRRMFAAVPEWERENERLALTVKCPFCTCYAPAGEPCRNFVRFRRAHEMRLARALEHAAMRRWGGA